jgi:hypothetical protein
MGQPKATNLATQNLLALSSLAPRTQYHRIVVFVECGFELPAGSGCRSVCFPDVFETGYFF